jgi:hypothetical protein
VCLAVVLLQPERRHDAAGSKPHGKPARAHPLPLPCPPPNPHPQSKCVGPARAASVERLDLAWQRARRQFGADYNGRLLSGLLMLAIAVIVVFRFLMPSRLLELVGWVAVIFLEVYPK